MRSDAICPPWNGPWLHRRPGRSKRCAPCAHEEHTMLDILMLALAAGLFALAIGYTYACERL
ncbi:hypothetical protein [Bradyrhizobium sp. SZCCHNS3053]|uniref:hypothetical protein n=1 Tax=Bradyrhizobium sp. SZCCHNS3053 TaxID=3057322 RepID=UPI002915FE8C|nr:hypothetical protein [Bradyrhizobium sp. SZCCHNS3053]